MIWNLAAEDVFDRDDTDEQSRPTWPSDPPPDAAPQPAEGAPTEPNRLHEADDTLGQRLVRLRGGDRMRAVSIDAALDRALAEMPTVRRVLRRRDHDARVAADPERLRDVVASMLAAVAMTMADAGPCAHALVTHTEVDRLRARVVVEVADLRRVWIGGDETPAVGADHRPADGEVHARASDAATGVVLSVATHPAFGRVARLEIPLAR